MTNSIFKVIPNGLGWLIITGINPPIQVYTQWQLDQLTATHKTY